MARSPTLRLNGLQRRYYEAFWNGVRQRFSSGNRLTKSPISSVLRPVVWLGNSKENLREFPDGAQRLLGDELQLIQLGGVSKKPKPIEFEEGSGNVVADLRLKDADQLLTRAHIRFHVFTILKDKKMKQREVAEVLGIAQPDESAPDERAFQPLHDGQAAQFYETA